MKPNFKTIMGWIKNAILLACLYTVAITFLFLILYSLEGWLDTPAIPLNNFFVIFMISLLVALAGILFKIPGLPKILAYLLNYTILIAGFFVIFVTSDKLSIGNSAGKVFVYVILMTVVYILVALAAFLIGKVTDAIAARREDTVDPVAKKKPSKHAKDTNESDDYQSML